nr:DUF1272 domain-containing protein [uncultured Tolumonas sp.]
MSTDFSFEYTFCVCCATIYLHDQSPNCGDERVKHPRRPTEKFSNRSLDGTKFCCLN